MKHGARPSGWRTGEGRWVSLALAGLTWVYVISPVEIHEYLKVTTDRITAGIVLTLVAAIPLLLSSPEQAPEAPLVPPVAPP